MRRFAQCGVAPVSPLIKWRATLFSLPFKGRAGVGMVLVWIGEWGNTIPTQPSP